MLMGNAGKTIKQVIFNIDATTLKPLVERLYYHNMQHAEDPDLKGDVNIVARGANSLVVKDAAQVRRNEFLQVVLSSPAVQQIVGMEGIAALLHEQAKTLDMDADAIVPSPEALMLKQMEQQAQMMQAPPAPEAQPGEGARRRANGGQTNEQQLTTGEPVTDNMGAPQGFADGGFVEGGFSNPQWMTHDRTLKLREPSRFGQPDGVNVDMNLDTTGLNNQTAHFGYLMGQIGRGLPSRLGGK